MPTAVPANLFPSPHSAAELPEPKEVKGEKGEGCAAPEPVPPPRVETQPTSAPVLPLSPLLPADAAPPPPLLLPGDDIYIAPPSTNPVIAALRQAGQYVAAIGQRQHAVTCPWAEEHAAADNRPALYVEPDRHRPTGTFTCPHHPAKGVRHLLEQLGVDKEEARCKPRLRFLRGETVRIADRAERILAATGQLYQAGGAIVTVDSRVTGDAAVRIVNEQALMKALDAATDFVRFNGEDKPEQRCDAPPKVVALLAKAADYEHLPVLDHIARQPYFTGPESKLVTQAGYNAETRTYAAFADERFPFNQPTRAAAETAMAALKGLVCEFHFAADTDRSAAVCGMLTAAARSSLPLAPAFNITASCPGSGKSYLADLLAAFAGRAEAMKLSYPTTSDEADKAILAALIEKPAAICFDDMQTDIRPHGTINRMLTSPTIAGRVLGASKTIQAGTGTFFLCTGNNIAPVRDMCRRVVTIRLAPNAETPATLAYNGSPVEVMKASRAQYVAHALTIIRAWIAAGSPKAEVPSIATFGRWADLCRHALLWLGEPDPASSLIDQVKDDPDAEVLGHFLWTWYKVLRDQPAMIRTVLSLTSIKYDPIREAIEELPGMDGKFINPGKLGWYMKRNAGRIVDGLLIEKGPTSERNSWRVKALDPAAADARAAASHFHDDGEIY